ncbi:DUF2975 domain-containing protein [Acetobacterium bakii]|uniref:Membrane protein n=1 Tax=Acetobacterium bakii TaxID=52689 RepID=A0A0L6TZU1_9FIRM|nr:DUF2975 domain-containing protein [Acetobacterium bakii]KNZ41602.1 membrane protein [Acetobacterium bakii]
MKGAKINFLKVAIVIIGVTILLLCVFGLPWLAEYSTEINPEYGYLKYPILIWIYITTIPFFVALFEGFKLLKYIESENAFSELGVESLNHIKQCGIGIIILYGIGLVILGFQNVLHPTMLIIAATIIFAALSISLFAAVLQELLKTALEIKSENDLTV